MASRLAALPPSAQHVVAMLRMHRTIGTAKRRTRIPRSRHPAAVELAYGTELVNLVHHARSAAAPAIAEMAKLLASAKVARGDSNPTNLVERLANRWRRDAVAGGNLSNGVSGVEQLDCFLTIKLQLARRCSGAVTAALENAIDRGFAHTESLGDRRDGSTRGTQSQRSVEVPFSRATVCAAMLRLIHDDEVRRIVVEPILVPMVDDFVRSQGPTDHPLHDDPMFKALAATVIDGAIERGAVERSDVAALLPHGVQDNHTEWAVVVRIDAGEGARARQLVDHARQLFQKAVHPNAIDTLARKFGKRTSDVQLALFKRQARAALGIDIATLDPRLPTLIGHFAAENVSLIKSLGNKTFDDIEKLATRAVTSGTRHEEMASDMENRFGIAERHARLIARDQIGKLNGQVTRARHKEVGINKFTWRTAGDERVRPEHEELDGQEFSYDDPPSEGLPGEPVCCRCGEDPVFDDLLGAADDDDDSDDEPDDN